MAKESSVDKSQVEPPDAVSGESAADSATTRRRLLVAGASTATALAAGCSDILSQSFEADAVTLSAESRETLRLQEVATESQTINREGPGGAEVTISSQVAVYNRADWLRDGSG